MITAIKNTFISLKFKNFRIYWAGMNVSLIGSWMQTIAQPWLALSITNDPFLVSIVAVMQFLPPLFLSLFSGAFVDRANTKSILIAAEIGLMLVALGFTLMVFLGFESYPLILVLAFFNGICNSFDAPARHAFVYEIVGEKSHLPNAIALNSMSFNLARVLGPAVAGIVIAALGIGYCFLINAISFGAILISLFFITPIHTIQKSGSYDGIIFSILQGLEYVKRKKIILNCILTILIMSMFLPHYNITVSAFAKFSLGGGEKTFGYLMSFLGIGSFFGALTMAYLGKVVKNVVYIMPFVVAIFLAFIGLGNSFVVASVFLMLTGFGFVMTTASLNSLVQYKTHDKFRGRVMSIYSLAFQGSVPFGAMIAGAFTAKFGASRAFMFCSLLCIICFLLKNLLLTKHKKG
ncbi:MAG: MFS transporter [Campylobacter sp.]|nr:MFS transporter [Campylobacter sp.]